MNKQAIIERILKQKLQGGTRITSDGTPAAPDPDCGYPIPVPYCKGYPSCFDTPGCMINECKTECRS